MVFHSRQNLDFTRIRGGHFPLDRPTFTAMIPPLFAPITAIFSMHGSLGTNLWTLFYFIVLLGLSLYGLHRYVIVYLFLKNRRPKLLLQVHWRVETHCFMASTNRVGNRARQGITGAPLRPPCRRV